MRSVRRTPERLETLTRHQIDELAKCTKHFEFISNGLAGAFRFSAYKTEAVKQALEELFHGKCAYCESVYASTAPVDVEHYRPKGAVDGADHPGYWWLAAEWTNLLPSCIDCNRRRKQLEPKSFTSLVDLQQNWRSQNNVILSGKKDSFPVAGQRAMGLTDDLALERPLLLDPCTDSPEKHLAFHVDHETPFGLVFPRPQLGNALPSERGAVSIQIYGLNRLSLVQERTRILLRLKFLADLIVDIAGIIEDLEVEPPDGKSSVTARAIERLRDLMQRVAGEIRGMSADDQPHAAMVRQWLTSFEEYIAGSASREVSP